MSHCLLYLSEFILRWGQEENGYCSAGTCLKIAPEGVPLCWRACHYTHERTPLLTIAHYFSHCLQS